MSIAVFLDGSHFSICTKKVGVVQTDFAKLRTQIETHCNSKIVEAYHFGATDDGGETSFHRALRQNGFRVYNYRYALEDTNDRYGKKLLDANGFPVQRRVEKGVDVGLAMEMLDSHRRRNWTRLVLSTGDADFAEPIKRLAREGVQITILGSRIMVSNDLHPYVDDYLEVSKIKDEIARELTPALNLRRTA